MADKFLDKSGVKVLWEEACKTFVDSTNYELDKAELEQAIAEAGGEIDLSEIEESIAGLEGDLSGLEGDISGLNSDLSNLDGRINSLEAGAEEVDGKIESAVNAAIADVVDSAPEAFDTLKEIADYIAEDKEGAADLASRIGALEEAEIPSLSKSEIKDICSRVYDEVVMSKYIVADKDEVLNALANIENGGSITLEENIDLGSQIITFPANKEVTLDLGGQELDLTSAGSTPGIQILGDVTIENGKISATKRALGVFEGGSLIIGEGAEVVSGDCAVSVTGAGSTVIVNDGEITAQESGILITSGAKVEVNGGKIIGLDNCPLQGNGTAGQGNIEIVMNDGELVANIQSAGYVACGVYMPNSGSFTMNGGSIVANGGAGVVCRGGVTTINGGSITATGDPSLTGKVGDSRVVVPCSAIVYDKNSKYPAMDSLAVVVNQGAILSGSKSEIEIISDEANPNVIDNR